MVKEFACQFRSPRRYQLDLWVGKIPWRRKWQPTLVSLPAVSHGQRSLAGYSPWCRKELDKPEYAHKANIWASQVALVVKNLPANAGNIRHLSLILGLERSPRKGYGNPLQYSCLENPMNREAWQATVHRVAKSWTWLKWLGIQHTKQIFKFLSGRLASSL